MSTINGNASRTRELARLFEAWRRAFDARDQAAMENARRALDTWATGSADMQVGRHLGPARPALLSELDRGAAVMAPTVVTPITSGDHMPFAGGLAQ